MVVFHLRPSPVIGLMLQGFENILLWGFLAMHLRATRSSSQISFVEERCHSLYAEIVKRNFSDACSSLSLPWLGRNFLSYWSFPLGRVSLVTATVLLSHVTCIESISDRLSGRNHFYLQLKM